MSGFSVNSALKWSTMAIPILLLAILFISMLFDLRTRQVPAVLTLGSLLGAAIFSLWQGNWSPVVLVVALIWISDWEPQAKRLAFSTAAAAFACIFQPAVSLLCLAIFALWMLWEFDLIGGADVKLLMAALLIFGNAALLLPVAMAGGVLGVLALLRKQRQIPYVPAIFAGSTLFWITQIF